MLDAVSEILVLYFVELCCYIVFLAMCKPREKFTEVNGAFHLVAFCHNL